MTSNEPDYDISIVRRAWNQNGTRYRRIITTSGKTVVEKGVNGRYVPDYIQGER